MSDKEACSRIEQRSVIKFLVAEGCKAVEIHRRISTVYNATCFITNKHKEQTQGRTYRINAKKTKRTNAGAINQKESSCIVTMQGFTQQPKRCRPSSTWAGNCSLIPFQPRPCHFRLSRVWSLEKSSREAQSLKVTMKSKVL